MLNTASPVHVHVRYGAGEAVFNMEPVIELRESVGMKVRELTRAEELAALTGRLSSRSGMSTLTDTARSARFHEGFIVIALESGAELRFLVAQNPRLARGTPSQLNHIDVSPFGLHWPDLDEDLSLRGIAEGNHGQHSAARAS